MVKAGKDKWDKTVIVKAEDQVPRLQRKVNLERLEAYPESIERRGPKNGFIMFRSVLGEPKTGDHKVVLRADSKARGHAETAVPTGKRSASN